MPVTLHTIALHTMRHRAEWRQVNAEFERVREALEWANSAGGLTPYEWRLLLVGSVAWLIYDVLAQIGGPLLGVVGVLAWVFRALWVTFGPPRWWPGVKH